MQFHCTTSNITHSVIHCYQHRAPPLPKLVRLNTLASPSRIYQRYLLTKSFNDARKSICRAGGESESGGGCINTSCHNPTGLISTFAQIWKCCCVPPANPVPPALNFESKNNRKHRQYLSELAFQIVKCNTRLDPTLFKEYILHTSLHISIVVAEVTDMLQGRSICSCDQFCLTTKQNTFFSAAIAGRAAAQRAPFRMAQLNSRPLALFSIVHPSPPPFQAFTSVSPAQRGPPQPSIVRARHLALTQSKP